MSLPDRPRSAADELFAEGLTLPKDVSAAVADHYGSLSRAMRRIADYVLAHVRECACLSISGLSRQTDTSPATVTRFVKSIGYPGYAEFQRGLYELQLKQTPFGSMKDRLRNAGAAGDDASPLVRELRENADLLEEAATPMLQESFVQCCDLLAQARRIYIVGQRSSYSIAFYLSFMLQRVRDGVVLLDPSAASLPVTLSGADRSDCLVAAAYARYTRVTFDVMKFFRARGCSVVSVTDSCTSPIAQVSDCVLTAPHGANFSPVCAMTLCSALAAELGARDPEGSLRRMEEQDRIALDSGIYL